MRPDSLLRSDVPLPRFQGRPADTVTFPMPVADDGGNQGDRPVTLRDLEARIGANLQTIDDIRPEVLGV